MKDWLLTNRWVVMLGLAGIWLLTGIVNLAKGRGGPWLPLADALIAAVFAAAALAEKNDNAKAARGAAIAGVVVFAVLLVLLRLA